MINLYCKVIRCLRMFLNLWPVLSLCVSRNHHPSQLSHSNSAYWRWKYHSPSYNYRWAPANHFTWERNAGLIVLLGSGNSTDESLGIVLRRSAVNASFGFLVPLPIEFSLLLSAATVATSPPSDSMCDFDHSLCGWTHDHNAPLLWSLHSHGECFSSVMWRFCMIHCHG